MPRVKSVVRCTDMIAASSSNNVSDNQELLGADHLQSGIHLL
jgi:hypothetical protein